MCEQNCSVAISILFPIKNLSLRMKNSVFSIALALVFCLSNLIVNSQNLSSKEVKSKIVKSWTATEVGAPNQAMFPKENKEEMDFKADGTLQVKQESKMMGTMTMMAKWHFDKKIQRLIMTIEIEDRKESQELEIIELTDTRLVLISRNKQTAYIPSELVVEEEASTEMPDSALALNPDSWQGSLTYNIVFVGDGDANVEQKAGGVITLSIANGVKIITKSENGNTIIWTVTSDMEMAGFIHYTVDCSDPKFSGEITFQNGGLLLEMYEPSYSSLLFINK